MDRTAKELGSMASQAFHKPVVLFGYEVNPFAHFKPSISEISEVIDIHGEVPSMMPRPLLVKLFGITYRKIPVLAIGQDVYCDTSIILEALEHQFPASAGYPSLYPRDGTGRTNRALIRGFASFWTDRPLFRVTTGLIPGSVWRTSFGRDRAGLIGHTLDADKLEKKLPQNLSTLDLHLSLFEEQLSEAGYDEWLITADAPSAADIALWYQLNWGLDISAGKGIYNLTGGGTNDTSNPGAKEVLNRERYPATWAWYERFQKYMDELPVTEKRIEEDQAISLLGNAAEQELLLIPTPASQNAELDAKNGLVPGAAVSVAPDDTGRANPTLGELIVITPEELVIKPHPVDGQKPIVDSRVHFPRIGFIVRPMQTAGSKL